jgi:hypothetical protein
LAKCKFYGKPYHENDEAENEKDVKQNGDNYKSFHVHDCKDDDWNDCNYVKNEDYPAIDQTDQNGLKNKFGKFFCQRYDEILVKINIFIVRLLVHFQRYETMNEHSRKTI